MKKPKKGPQKIAYTPIRIGRATGKASKSNGGPFLRVFRNRPRKHLRAGLYATSSPKQSDHWKNGRPLTNRADAVRAKRDANGNEQAENDILIGIAYARLSESPADAGNQINVPSELKRWNARVDDISSADYDQYLAADGNILKFVMADHARHRTQHGNGVLITVIETGTLENDPSTY